LFTFFFTLSGSIITFEFWRYNTELLPTLLAGSALCDTWAPATFVANSYFRADITLFFSSGFSSFCSSW